MEKPILYGLGFSPSAQRVFATLAHKGIDYEMIEVDITKKERPAEFTAVSPFGKVPVLAHDGRNIFESVIINEYLNEVWPDPPMLPEDPGGRAYVREWITVFNRAVTDRDAAAVHVERDRDAKIATCRGIFPDLAPLDRELSDKSGLFVGDELSLMDVAVAPFTKGLRIMADLIEDRQLESYPSLLAYFDRLEAHPELQEPVYSVPEDALRQFFTMILVDGATIP